MTILKLCKAPVVYASKEYQQRQDFETVEKMYPEITGQYLSDFIIEAYVEDMEFLHIPAIRRKVVNAPLTKADG